MKSLKQQAQELAERVAKVVHYQYSEDWYNQIPEDSKHRYHYNFKEAETKRKKFTDFLLKELSLEQLIADKLILDKLDLLTTKPGKVDIQTSNMKFIVYVLEDKNPTSFRLAITNAIKEGGER